MFSYGKIIPNGNVRKEKKINCFLKICVQYVQLLSRKEEAASDVGRRQPYVLRKLHVALL